MTATVFGVVRGMCDEGLEKETEGIPIPTVGLKNIYRHPRKCRRHLLVHSTQPVLAWKFLRHHIEVAW